MSVESNTENQGVRAKHNTSSITSLNLDRGGVCGTSWEEPGTRYLWDGTTGQFVRFVDVSAQVKFLKGPEPPEGYYSSARRQMARATASASAGKSVFGAAERAISSSAYT